MHFSAYNKNHREVALRKDQLYAVSSKAKSCLENVCFDSSLRDSNWNFVRNCVSFVNFGLRNFDLELWGLFFWNFGADFDYYLLVYAMALPTNCCCC